MAMDVPRRVHSWVKRTTETRRQKDCTKLMGEDHCTKPSGVVHSRPPTSGPIAKTSGVQRVPYGAKNGSSTQYRHGVPYGHRPEQTFVRIALSRTLSQGASFCPHGGDVESDARLLKLSEREFTIFWAHWQIDQSVPHVQNHTLLFRLQHHPSRGHRGKQEIAVGQIVSQSGTGALTLERTRSQYELHASLEFKSKQRSFAACF